MTFLNIKPTTATLLDTTNMSTAQAKRLEQRDDIDHQPRVDVRHAFEIAKPTALMIGWLEQAAARYAVRRDNFAIGKSATCSDIASKLQRFGAFASDRQEDFAKKLIEWSLPRGAAMPWATPVQVPVATPVQPEPAAPAVMLPKLFDLMQRLAKLEIGSLKIARKNGDSLCWLKHTSIEGVFGKLEGGRLVLFHGRIAAARLDPAILVDELLRIEQDPQAAAVLHGKASGRCSICSRDLTDPVSIARGIGPICINKAGW